MAPYLEIEITIKFTNHLECRLHMYYHPFYNIEKKRIIQINPFPMNTYIYEPAITKYR